jgi:dihydroorotate dehydrogenase (fumarate)
MTMPDLRTRYLGIDLASPLVASAGPMNADMDWLARLEAAGAAAVVLPSLFEEEIEHEDVQLSRALESGAEHFAEALDYFPASDTLGSTLDRYLGVIEAAKARVGIPVIASLNATSKGGWIRYARLLEAAGADAVELNVYAVAADPDRSGADVEQAEIDLVEEVRAALRVPLAVKLGPYYSSFSHFATRVIAAGADGLVLFNRFYQPDLDIATREVVPSVELSQPWELRLPLRWIAILRARLDVSLAATTGVHDSAGAAKCILVGADAVMMTSALLRHGPEHIGVVEAGLRMWMAEHEYDSVAQIRGSVSYRTAEDPSAFERANYMSTLHSWVAPADLTPSAPGGPDVGEG